MTQQAFSNADGDLLVVPEKGKPFQLPGLGPIGSNGLANPRDFLAPVARFEDNNLRHELIMKFHGKFWKSHTHHSPFDVVEWHGNFYPRKYTSNDSMSLIP